jgi:hypothetical protein
VGGFGVGQILGDTFSILGAVGGSLLTAALLLSLGAFFDYQDRKKPQRDTALDPVFERMITGKPNPSRTEVDAARKRIMQAAMKKKNS